jgi:hypothetical protein
MRAEFRQQRLEPADAMRVSVLAQDARLAGRGDRVALAFRYVQGGEHVIARISHERLSAGFEEIVEAGPAI